MKPDELEAVIDSIFMNRPMPRRVITYVCIDCRKPGGTLIRRPDGTYAHGKQTPCEKVAAEEAKASRS